MTFSRLSNSVYARVYPGISSAVDSNKGYVICDRFVVVVDTSYMWNNVRSDLQELKEITDREVGYVINTHYHTDHAYGNALFTCPIIAHNLCLKMLEEEHTRQIAELLQEDIDDEIKASLQRFGPRYPTITFETTYRIKAKPAIEIIHLGGHTPDLSVVRIPEEGVLFASDNLFGSRDPSVPSHPYIPARSDLNRWISALRAILKMEVKTIVPGHRGLCNKKAVQTSISYLELFISNLRKLKKQGYTKEEIKRNPELLKLPKLQAKWNVENSIETQFDKL